MWRKKARPEPDLGGAKQELLGYGQGHLDEVVADEPGLELVGAEDVRDYEIVGAVVV